MMINFNKVTLADKQWMRTLLGYADMRGCHQNFTNMFARAEIYNVRAARVNDYLVVKEGKDPARPYYFFPAGRGDLREVIDAMIRDAGENGHKFIMAGVSPENIEALEQIYPARFTFQETRDDDDYLYYLDKLVKLPGKKLQGKRNHINRFMADNHNWGIETITAGNLEECWAMNLEWCRRNECIDSEELVHEFCAGARMFRNYFALELEGALLRVDGRVIAFTIGGRLNSDTFDINIEKAFAEIQGAYQLINRSFAEMIQQKYPQLLYVNREEDIGDEGLRKAKLSYHPDRMEKKFEVVLKDESLRSIV